MMKKLILILFALAAVVTASSAKDLPKIHVEGKNFVDENGKSVIFKGLCFSDPVVNDNGKVYQKII